MPSNTERAETARQQGNALYKSLRMTEAIKSYSAASAFAPSDPTPLSNLAAATFEAGDYEKSVKFANEALALLEGEADNDPQKLKLLTRKTKAKLYLSEPEDPKAKEVLRDTIFQLPRYRPYLNEERGHYPVGHDTPSSQYDLALKKTTKDAQLVSILFCGIGDARHLFQTMMVYVQDYVEQAPKSDQRICFTILDHKSAMLARDLIMFALLDELSDAMGPPPQHERSVSQEQRAQMRVTLSVICYLYVAQVIPAYVWNRLQTTIQRLLDSFAKSEQPISWVYVPLGAQDAIRRSLKSWKSEPNYSYSTERFRRLTAAENQKQKIMLWQMDIDDIEPLPHLKFEHRVYEDFSIVLPEKYLMETHEPELAKIVQDYRDQDESAKSRLSDYIDNNWMPNITLADIEWENENAGPESEPIPDLSFTPFSVAKFLAQACVGESRLEALSQDGLFSLVDLYFIATVNAITLLRGRMMVNVCLGEMSDVLERMRYQAFDHSEEPESKSGLVSSDSKWPDRYHVIHMSNIPDYYGGSFTSFLYGMPILEHGSGTGLVSNVLRNSNRWRSISQFLSEYLLMYDRELIKSHFQLKLSPDTPENSRDQFPLIRYFLWERIRHQPLTFEQLMPQTKLLHWLHAHFLKLCLPYPQIVSGKQPPIYAPLNMTAFFRLIMRVSELGYPTHWLSNLAHSILSGNITTTARPPIRVALTPSDVDEVHPAQTFCTKPWKLEFSTLGGLWRGSLPSGLITPTSVPRAEDIIQHTLAFPYLEIYEYFFPHSMLVFYDKQKFGALPKNLRALLMDNDKVYIPNSQAIREKGIHCLSTFAWKEKLKEVTFWMSKEAVDEMKGWWVYVCKTDSWEQVGKGVKLGDAVARGKLLV